MKHSLAFIVLSGTLVLASCASDGTVLSPSQRLVATDWRADQINGQTPVTPNPVTLSFNESNASGRSGCNQYSGAVEYDDRAITFRTIISTKMACIGDGVMATEAAYLSALQATQSYSISADGSLTLTGPTARIHFVPQSRQIRPS